MRRGLRCVGLSVFAVVRPGTREALTKGSPPPALAVGRLDGGVQLPFEIIALPTKLDSHAVVPTLSSVHPSERFADRPVVLAELRNFGSRAEKLQESPLWSRETSGSMVIDYGHSNHRSAESGASAMDGALPTRHYQGRITDRMEVTRGESHGLVT